MTIDIDNLSARELDSLISKAKKRKTTLKKRKPAAIVRARLTALARTEGYTIAELFGTAAGATPRAARSTRTAPKTGTKVAPKYRNPANAEQTWAGRGKQPRWLAEEVAKGRKIEEFLIV